MAVTRARRAAVALVLASLCIMSALACKEPEPVRGTPTVLPAEAPAISARKADLREVRAYPPHAIRADGIGPYRIGESLTDVLHLVPQSPRVELLRIGRHVDWRLVRAELGNVIIGADGRNQVAFVTVLTDDVARTADGAAVGMTLAELGKKRGAHANDAASPASFTRLVEWPELPGVIFVMDRLGDAGHVLGVVLGRDGLLSVFPETAPATASAGSAAPPAAGTCHAPWSAKARAQLLERIAPAEKATAVDWMFGCMTSSTADAVLRVGDQLWVATKPESAPPLRLQVADGTQIEVADVDNDGRDELILLATERTPEALTLKVEILRAGPRRFVSVLKDEPLVVTESDAAAAGTTLAGLELIAEPRRAPRGAFIAGVFVLRANRRIRDLVPVGPLPLRLPGPTGRNERSADRPKETLDDTPLDATPADSAPIPSSSPGSVE